VERLQPRETKERRRNRERGRVEPPRAHPRKVDLPPPIAKPQIPRPKKRINVQVNDNRLMVQPPRPIADFDIQRLRPKRRFGIVGEE